MTTSDATAIITHLDAALALADQLALDAGDAFDENDDAARYAIRDAIDSVRDAIA